MRASLVECFRPVLSPTTNPRGWKQLRRCGVRQAYLLRVAISRSCVDVCLGIQASSLTSQLRPYSEVLNLRIEASERDCCSGCEFARNQQGGPVKLYMFATDGGSSRLWWEGSRAVGRRVRIRDPRCLLELQGCSFFLSFGLAAFTLLVPFDGRRCQASGSWELGIRCQWELYGVHTGSGA